MTRLHPILVVSVIGAIAAFCILQVRFSANLYEMLPSDLPEVQGMDRLNRYFSRDGQLIVTIKADEAYVADEAVVSLADHLEGETELVSEVYRELSLTELVTEGGGLLAWLWLNAPPEELAGLAERLSGARSRETIEASMATVMSSGRWSRTSWSRRRRGDGWRPGTPTSCSASGGPCSAGCCCGCCGCALRSDVDEARCHPGGRGALVRGSRR